MAWPQDAYVGQEVVCIAVITPQFNGVICPTKKDKVYKITSIYISGYNGDICFNFEGINPSPLKGFNHHGFRPVIRRKTDISIFTAMLGPKVKEEV